MTGKTATRLNATVTRKMVTRMNPYRIARSSLLLLLLLHPACDQGLEPPQSGQQSTTGSFSGVVTFTNWQAVDSLYDIRLVAFTVFPPSDVIDEVLQGRAVVLPPLGAGALVMRGADSVLYSLTLQPGIYPYVAVAHQFGPDLFADWRPVGQYDLDTNLAIPSMVEVGAGMNTAGINIHVDFDNLPPNPQEARE